MRRCELIEKSGVVMWNHCLEVRVVGDAGRPPGSFTNGARLSASLLYH